MPLTLPPYAQLVRTLVPGCHPYLALLPGVGASPALTRISPEPEQRARLLQQAAVQIRGGRGYAFVDVELPCIVLSEWYYRDGSALDLYLDLLHELTHLRQLEQGLDLWDERFEYVDRPTEVEGYAVAIEEGRRLGMSEQEVMAHLDNPWLSRTDQQRLLDHVNGFLMGGVLPNLELARQVVERRPRRPW